MKRLYTLTVWSLERGAPGVRESFTRRAAGQAAFEAIRTEAQATGAAITASLTRGAVCLEVY